MLPRRKWHLLQPASSGSFSSYARRISPLMDALSAVRRGDSHIAEVDLGGATIEGFDIKELVHTPGEAPNVG
jgi:hypothetical protein